MSAPASSPSDFVASLGAARAVAILRCHDQELASGAMDAAVRGGFRMVEVTLTVPGALEVIADLARRPELTVGAGTVLTVAEAERAVAAGARFLVSPVLDLEAAAAGRALGVAILPGTHTPTEMFAAYRAGAPLQKLFPAPGAGPDYVRACLAPLPFLRLVPTNGVDEANAAAWLAAGAFAVGFAGALFAPADLAARDCDRIEARARRLLAAIASIP